jgi:radical SAM superfamily enzyme YgiQ (UPF0313 family)
MRRYGCSYIYYGLESGSARVQEAIQKKQQRERTIEAIRATRRCGMVAVASFIFGVPLASGEEGEEDWAQSVELIRAAEPKYVVPTIFAYYPQSPAWRFLNPRRKSEYVAGASRDMRWNWFDDGYGAIHHVELARAEEIREYLEREIPEKLWPGNTDVESRC